MVLIFFLVGLFIISEVHGILYSYDMYLSLLLENRNESCFDVLQIRTYVENDHGAYRPTVFNINRIKM